MQRKVNLHSLMKTFADTTGLSDASHNQRRYLWTDAFAVCNYLELFRQTDKREYMQLCLKLVDQVHHVLGKNRDDDIWLSGLDDEEASLHPTLGGLRIGKQLNEREANEPFDVHLEWQRDGQYFHYLTKWMHALNCVSQVTRNGIYNQWAIELAQVSHAAFTYGSATAGVKQMYWKMSTDLSRPLVGSMGQHDPLDGLITYQQLEATAKLFPETSQKLSLKTEIEELSTICLGLDWATRDSLGIGGLLTDAYSLVQLIYTQQLHDDARLESLLQDIERSLQAFITDNLQNPLNLPAESRLAFRELGLAIGLYSINKMQAAIKEYPENFTHVEQLNSSLTNLLRFYPVYDFIRDFWLEPGHRSVSTWLEHADINNVMLATCLAPDSYLKI